MLNKIIVACVFIGGVIAFFILLSDIDSGIKEANKANQVDVVEAEAVKTVKKRAKSKITAAVERSPVDAGYSLFKRRCLGCHTSDKGQPNRTGPNLWGIIDKPKAVAENFRYSRELKIYGGVWSEAEISKFIAGPRAMIRDTKMTFKGIKVEKDRNNIIAYLKTLKD